VISLLYKFDNLADYGEFVEELPWNKIVHDMQAGRQTRSLHPVPIDWNLSNELAPYSSPFTPEGVVSQASFDDMLYKSSWRELRPDTPVGWATRDYVGQIIITPWIQYRYGGKLEAKLGQNAGGQNTIEWLKNDTPTYQLEMNCYYINTENDIWLAQVTLLSVLEGYLSDVGEEYQVESVGVYRREVTTNVPAGNAWFYNHNRPDIYWFRPGSPENEGPYGGEIIAMPHDWERDATSMKPLQAQFNTLADFMELKLKIDPWSGYSPDYGGLTGYLNKIRSTDSPFMIPLPIDSIKGRIASITHARFQHAQLGGSSHWPYMYVLGSRPRAMNYPRGL
jgi:hypothetical protein